MKYGKGEMIRVKVTTADVGRFLSVVNESGIPVFDLKPETSLEVLFAVRRDDLQTLKSLADKRGEVIKIVGVQGYIWKIRNVLARPILILTLLILLVLTIFLPTRILFVTIEGNSAVSQHRILTAAAGCGIRFGASRRALRSEKCKNFILSQIPQLQWVGVNSYGCVARVSVRERTEQDSPVMSGSISGLGAVTDGVIREMTVTAGNPLCAVGDAVSKGQMLVSAYTDCGLFIRSEPAQAEIYADTAHALQLVSPINFNYRIGNRKKKKKYSLRIGKKVINFFKDSGILDTGCVKMYEEYDLALNEDLVLPLSIIEYTFVYSDSIQKQTSTDSDFLWVPPVAERLLTDNMTAGEIRGCRANTSFDDVLYYYYGQYDCYEMIAQPFNEEIVINHEQGN